MLCFVVLCFDVLFSVDLACVVLCRDVLYCIVWCVYCYVLIGVMSYSFVLCCVVVWCGVM